MQRNIWKNRNGGWGWEVLTIRGRLLKADLGGGDMLYTELGAWKAATNWIETNGGVHADQISHRNQPGRR